MDPQTLQLLQLLQNGGGQGIDPAILQQLFNAPGGPSDTSGVSAPDGGNSVGIGQFEQNQFGGGGPAQGLGAPLDGSGMPLFQPSQPPESYPGQYRTPSAPGVGQQFPKSATNPGGYDPNDGMMHLMDAPSSQGVSGPGAPSDTSGLTAPYDLYDGGGGNIAPDDGDWFGGDLANTGQSARTNLGEMPGQVAGQFDSPFLQNYGGSTDWFQNRIANSFGDFPQAQAAQMDLSKVPQANTQAAGGSDALNFLLSGQGYDPRTLAMMNAGVTDNAAASGRSQAGNARLMAEQAGIGGSPAEMALEAGARRNQASQTQQGLNNVQIQNAQQGMQNLTTGAGMQQQLNLSNSQQANMMALQNVQSIIQGMNTNVANTQQANMANYSGGQQAAMAKSGAQAGYLANAGSGLQNSMLNKQTNADTQNASAKNAWAVNQGNLDQNNSQFNTNVGENRWAHSLDALGQLVNGTNPLGYDTNATSALSNQTTNVSPTGSVLQDIGTGILSGKPTNTMDKVA